MDKQTIKEVKYIIMQSMMNGTRDSNCLMLVEWDALLIGVLNTHWIGKEGIYNNLM